MKFPTQAFILCAGKGTRLGDLTLDKPKCLLDVAGKPVLGHILSWLKRYDIQEVIVNLHWQAEMVMEYLADNDYGLKVHCSYEDELMGTAGGIRNCLEMLHGQFLVVYGDILTNMDLFRLFASHHNRNAAISLVSHKVANPWECGVILAREDEEVVGLWEKPDKSQIVSDEVNAGVMMFKRCCFELVPFLEPWDIARDLVPAVLAKEWPVFHKPLQANEWLIDMGTGANYERACEKLREVE